MSSSSNRAIAEPGYTSALDYIDCEGFEIRFDDGVEILPESDAAKKKPRGVVSTAAFRKVKPGADKHTCISDLKFVAMIRASDACKKTCRPLHHRAHSPQASLSVQSSRRHAGGHPPGGVRQKSRWEGSSSRSVLPRRIRQGYRIHERKGRAVARRHRPALLCTRSYQINHAI